MPEDRGPYKCTLSPELIIKAQTELYEDPRTRHQAIESLRQRVLENKALTCRTDDRFLLRFLRARKFSQDRAYNLLINYFTIRAQHRTTFKNLTPKSVKNAINTGVIGVLPFRDKEGRRIMFSHAGNWNPDKFSIWDILKVEVMALEQMIEEEETQINGLIMVCDLTGFSIKHVTAMDRDYARAVTSIFQDSFPIRIKCIHMINEPTIVDMMMALMRPFMKDKLLSRMKFHGHNLTELHEKYVEPELLPEEAGGTRGPFSNEGWLSSILKLQPMFEEMEKYELILTDSTISKQKGSGDVAEDSALTGTFKKLNVD